MVRGKTVLIVDDEPSFTWAVQQTLGQWGYAACSARSVEEVLDVGWRRPPDCILLDVRLPGMSGLAGISHLARRWPDAPVIVVTAFGTVTTAVESVRQGAFDYLVKPFDPSELKGVVERALSRTPPARGPDRDRGAGGPGPEIVGRSRVMQEVYKLIAKAAAGNVSVLITGPTGSGKELVARAIHEHGPKAARPMMVLNCASLDGSLVDSELFGYVKGAFSGADDDRPGKIEQADGGTLFLDEVADLPLQTQGKLLRFLDDGSYYRVGDHVLRRCRCRVLAATNQSLEGQVAAGRFRADLYYRLAGLSIRVPSLAERGEDLDLLIDYCLDRYSAGAGRNFSISPAARRVLGAYGWPGNVRELFQALEHACTLALDGVAAVEHLPQRLRRPCGGQADEELATLARRCLERVLNSDDIRSGYQRLVACWERELLSRAYQHFGGNQRQMAKALGMHRTTLRAKLRSAGILAS